MNFELIDRHAQKLQDEFSILKDLGLDKAAIMAVLPDDDSMHHTPCNCSLALARCDCARANPFSDEALGERTPEAIAQDDRQAADEMSDAEYLAAVASVSDYAVSEARYHAALVVIANEQGAGRYARAINLVAKIWGKTEHEVLVDAVSL